MTGSYYEITMRLLYDYYVVPTPCLSYSNTLTTPLPLAKDTLMIASFL